METLIVSSTRFAVVGIIALIIIIPSIRSQLSVHEVPAELQYVPLSNISEWEPPEELSQRLPYYLSGFDYENRPIWVVELGKWDIRGLLEQGKEYENLLDKYLDKWMWRLYDSTNIKATKEIPVKDGVLIIDFEGLSVRQITTPTALGFFLKKLRTVVFALPLAHDVFAVNVNFVAKNFLDLVKPIVGRDFYRIEIFGTNPNSYRPVLIKRLPKDQLPEWYGGDKEFKPISVYG